jgi:hypothetical protein
LDREPLNCRAPVPRETRGGTLVLLQDAVGLAVPLRRINAFAGHGDATLEARGVDGPVIAGIAALGQRIGRRLAFEEEPASAKATVFIDRRALMASWARCTKMVIPGAERSEAARNL